MLRYVILTLVLVSCAQANETPVNALSAKTLSLAGGDVKPTLDLVVVVDNSALMTRAVGRLRQSFPAFFSQLQAKFDVNAAVLSRTGNAGTRFRIEAEGNKRDLDVFVGGSTPLAFALAASCNPSETEVRRSSRNEHSLGKICNAPIVTSRPEHNAAEPWYALPSYVSQINSETLRGSLLSFYRPLAHRVFLFVTNDESRGVATNDFLAVASQNSSGTKIFTFHATTNSKCSIVNIGQSYENLAHQSGGLSFDVCDRKWSDDFSLILENLSGSI